MVLENTALATVVIRTGKELLPLIGKVVTESTNAGRIWFSTRRAILKRDGYKCTECFSTGPLDVHHIVPFRMFDEVDEANKHDNLITLCKPCHRAEDAKYKWIKFDEGVLQFDSQGQAWQMSRQLEQRV